LGNGGPHDEHRRRLSEEEFSMQAKDIMSTPIVAVGPDAPLRDVVALMLERHISGVPVMADGRLLGVINESDLLRRFEIGTESCAAENSWWTQLVHRDRLPIDYVKSHARLARDIMTSPVVTVTEEASIQKIASVFAARHIRRIPVLRGRSVVGIVTRADLVKAIALRTKDEQLPGERSDEAIRSQLLDELQKQHWWYSVSSSFDVRDGAVHFHGLCESESDRRAARIAAENVPGVRSVEDHRTATASFQPMA
jgi:CBS domain-containing protein